MAWTTPQTWADGNVLTAAELNEQVRDNLNFLFSKPSDNYVLNEAADYTTTSTTFVDVDATNLALTITTGGGDVLLWFYGYVELTVNRAAVYFDIDMDGSRLAGDDGMTVVVPSYALGPVGFTPHIDFQANVTLVYLVTGLSAGSHTFKLQWKVSGSGMKLLAGAGTTKRDVHSQFGVREL